MSWSTFRTGNRVVSAMGKMPSRRRVSKWMLSTRRSTPRSGVNWGISSGLMISRRKRLVGCLEQYKFRVLFLFWKDRTDVLTCYSTESFDSMDDIGVDPRWEAFGPFHDYLLKSYPLTYVSAQRFWQLLLDCTFSHTSLSFKKVNTWGLLYEWTGSDSTLKPIVLAAHQGKRGTSMIITSSNVYTHHLDVVPVDPNTVDDWIHPPYSGYFDGKSLMQRPVMRRLRCILR